MSFRTIFDAFQNRLFLLYGMTDDRFVPSNLEVLTLPQWLLRFCKERGYERCIFFDRKNKISFFDEETRSSIRQEQRGSPSPPSQQSRFSGPLGRMSVRKKQENSDTMRTPEAFPSMDDSEVLSAFTNWSQSPTPTAFIFLGAEDFFSGVQAHQDLWSSTFAEMRRLPLENKNIAIFIQGPHLKAMERFPGLASLFFQDAEYTKPRRDRVFRISTAKLDEVKNLLHRMRLLKLLSTDAATIEKNAVRISQELVPESLEETERSLDTLYREAERGLGKEIESGWKVLRQMEGMEGVESSLTEIVALTKRRRSLQQPTKDSLDVPPLPLFALQRFSTRESKQGASNEPTFHLALLGNPGTGKTTLAGYIARIYREEGLLELGHLVTVTRKNIVEEHVGGSAKRTEEAIQRAIGGVLFVDEAYQLASDDFGREALDTLMEAMTAYSGRFALILAGYTKQILDMLDGAKANPGLPRRFSSSNRLFLADATPDALLSIFFKKLQNLQLTVEPRLKPLLLPAFTFWHQQRDPEKFGNAGEVHNLVDALERLAIKDERTTIQLNDFIKLGWSHYFVEENHEGREKNVLRELQELVGLKSTKQRIEELASLVEVNRRMGKSENQAVGHFAFVGNPGTGKTSVARIWGKMLLSLGLLKRGHCLEVRREHFVGRYQGDTEEKTRGCIEKALDGVLFIDEAHQLVLSEIDTYGLIASGALLAAMENYRDRLCVVIAGYQREIDTFLKRDPGFESRINHFIQFDDYTAEELLEISFKMLKEQERILTNEAETIWYNFLSSMPRSETFGNARFVRKLVGSLVSKQSLRVVRTNTTNLCEINEVDVLGVINENRN